MALGDLLAGKHEDPASTAARNIDRAEFLDDHDVRYTAMLRCAVLCKPMNGLGGKPRASNSALGSLTRRLAADIHESMGEDIPQEACRRPRWQADVEAEHDWLRRRHERRHLVH